MMPPDECDCYIDGRHGGISFCKLHSAAFEMSESLKRLVSAVRNLEEQEIQYSLAMDLSIALKMAERSIKKAGAE